VFYSGTYEKGLKYAKDAEHTSHPESSQSEKEGFKRKRKRRTAKVYSSDSSEGINYKSQTPLMRLVVQLIYD
jgi:hypothetical protein